MWSYLPIVALVWLSSEQWKTRLAYETRAVTLLKG
jgi:hypothetical protein